MAEELEPGLVRAQTDHDRMGISVCDLSGILASGFEGMRKVKMTNERLLVNEGVFRQSSEKAGSNQRGIELAKPLQS